MKKIDIKYIVLTFLFYIVYNLYYVLIVPKFNAYGIIKFSYFINIGDTILILLFLTILYLLYNFDVNSIDRSNRKDKILSFIILPIMFVWFEMYISKDLSSFVNRYLSINLNDIAIQKAQNVTNIVLLGTVIIGPILEEIVFRKMIFGMIYDILDGSNKNLRFVTSSIFSSFLFAVMHDGLFSQSMVNYMISGILLSVIYFYTKRISSSIIAHGLRNLFAFVFRNI